MYGTILDMLSRLKNCLTSFMVDKGMLRFLAAPYFERCIMVTSMLMLFLAQTSESHFMPSDDVRNVTMRRTICLRCCNNWVKSLATALHTCITIFPCSFQGSLNRRQNGTRAYCKLNSFFWIGAIISLQLVLRPQSFSQLILIMKPLLGSSVFWVLLIYFLYWNQV